LALSSKNFKKAIWKSKLDKGGPSTPYRSINLVKDAQIVDSEFQKVEEILKKCGGEKTGRIVDVIALQNDALEKSFIFYCHSLIEKFRSSPILFKKENWKSKQDKDERLWVHEQYLKFSKQFKDWTEHPDVPVLPVFQGTSKATAYKIAQTGFSTVATLDDGFYGRGMYFTSSINYASYYSRIANKGKSDLSYIIIAFVSPGNVYPVIEGPLSPNSLRGTAGVINPGYQSHYVCVGTLGSKLPGIPCTAGSKEFVDEFVVFQDAQALPKYIVAIENPKV